MVSARNLIRRKQMSTPLDLATSVSASSVQPGGVNMPSFNYTQSPTGQGYSMDDCNQWDN